MDFKVLNARKSERSVAHGACVEVGEAPGLVVVRDTVQGSRGPALAFPLAAFAAFTASLR